jgi:hypothetical protein
MTIKHKITMMRNGGTGMNENFFNNEVQKLVIEFKDKGFTMSKERAKQWYEMLSEYTDNEFKNAIDKLLKEISYCPTIADIFKYLPVKSVYIDRSNYTPVDFSFLDKEE